MSGLLIGLLGALVATNQPAAVSNLISQTTGLSVNIPDSNDPVEKEYQKLMADDDAAQAEVDQWIRENQAFAIRGGGEPNDFLNARIFERFDLVKRAYDDFLRRHPDHERAHVAYGSFLNDIKDEDGAEREWDKARQLDPRDPAPWNNLANLYGHEGPVTKAFEYYEKAIELDPREPVYYHNFGTTVFLFRKDAREYYHIDEQQVFNKALDLYQKAMENDPTNFELAQDVAETYYGIKPVRLEAALNAWTNALKLAESDVQKEGVYIHFARLLLHGERFDEARAQLNLVTNENYSTLKNRLLRNINQQESQAKTNQTPPTEIK
jgi:tetratricopeptide (TPR) repeat protein